MPLSVLTDMKNILIIHQNLPSQYRYLLNYLKRREDVTLVGVKEQNMTSPYSDHTVLNGMNIIEYQLDRKDRSADGILLSVLDEHITRGSVLVKISKELISHNFIPDFVIVHTGWGEALFLKTCFPKAKLVILQELFHTPQSEDINFDPEFLVDDTINAIAVMNRTIGLQACFDADKIMVPSLWQAAHIPPEFQHKVTTMHDGVDTNYFAPNDTASFTLPDGRVLTKKDKVLTYIARGLEPYRGYHSFIRAIPEIQRQDPDIEIVIVGNDYVYYGPKLADKTLNYRELYFNEIKERVDCSKIHFFGKIPQANCLSLFQISSAHACYTYPFYGSLSILEAMSCGCKILGSSTGPITENVIDGETGYLFDFFNYQEFANLAVRVINDKSEENEAIGHQAREYIKTIIDWETVVKPFWDDYLGLDA